MTTRQGSRSSSRSRSGGSSRSSGKGRSTGRSRGRSGTSRSSGSRKSSSRKQPPPTLTSRALRSSGRVLGDHADDVTGLLFVGLAVIAGLGVYGEGGGPVGRGIADLAASALGWMRFALPVGLFLGGGALILRRGGTEQPDDDGHASVAAHVGVGTTLLVIAGAGSLHLAGGRPGFGAPVEELRESGGWFGVAVGSPLVNLVGTTGTAAVLALVAVVALVVLTRTPLRDAADRTVAGVRPLTSGLNHRLASLFRLPYEDDAVQVGPQIDDIDPALVPDDDTPGISSPPTVLT